MKWLFAIVAFLAALGVIALICFGLLGYHWRAKEQIIAGNLINRNVSPRPVVT
jgi:hypothetical protein